MAPFTSRQTNYIRAIAGQQQHKTLICRQAETSLVHFSPPNIRNDDQAKLYGRAWHLNNVNFGSYPGAPSDPIESTLDKTNGGLCNLVKDLAIKSGSATTIDPHGQMQLLSVPAVISSATANTDITAQVTHTVTGAIGVTDP